MDNKIMNTKKIFKICIIAYAIIIAAGIICTAVMGPKLDINFIGGTRLTYSYEGEVSDSDFNAAISEVIKQDFAAGQNKSLAGDKTTYTISLSGRDSLSAELQEDITSKLQETFKDNKFELYDSTSVSPTVAGSFFAKSLVAVLITAALVVIYVGIRFRNIGGVSAALTALCALVLDLLISFFACIIFRLQIDSNYMAVVLTILGYSLNDTIVIYDRIRENKKLYPQLSIGENVDMSISGVLTRNIITTVTTVLAVITIIVVSELYGLTTLRTFAIPMAFGLVSGCLSSVFVACPLWVIWKNFISKKKV